MKKMNLFIRLFIAVTVLARLAACGAADPPGGFHENATIPIMTPAPSPEANGEAPFADFIPPENLTPNENPPAAPKQIEILGEFKTEILDDSPDRVSNLKLASSVLEGRTVASGGEFSFNATLGERTPEKGYKKAIMIDGEERKMVYGGGVCQISSTLYNAAENAGMEILERNNHSKNVGYVEQGDDAAVSFGNLDFEFKNPLPHPIAISMRVEDGYVYAAIIKAV